MYMPLSAKKIYLVFAVLLLWLPAVQASGNCEENSHYVPVEQRYTSGLLFKIEKCGYPTSYIFGTVHLARPEIARAAGEAFLTLADVDEAGFELAESEDVIAAAGMKVMKYPEGGPPHSLRPELGEKSYEHLLDILKNSRIEPRAMEQYRPWALGVMLELIDEMPGRVLDEKIRNVAISLHKPVFGLEKIEDQMGVFLSIPETMQVTMLKDAVDNYSEYVSLKKSMLDAYLRQDMKKIEALENSSNDLISDPEAEAFLDEHLIRQRNVAMEKNLLPYLKSKRIMVSVGAMHLMGDKGILHLLEQDGYYITPIP